MLWEDKTLDGQFLAPKIFHVFAIGVLCYLLYICGYLTVIKIGKARVLDWLVPGLVFCYFAFLLLSSTLLVLKGGRYVKIVKQEGSTFFLCNIHRKEFVFGHVDVRAVELVKYSFMDQVMIGFAKYKPGYNLHLKNGKTFFITAEMESLDTLKAALLGKSTISE